MNTTELWQSNDSSMYTISNGKVYREDGALAVIFGDNAWSTSSFAYKNPNCQLEYFPPLVKYLINHEKIVESDEMFDEFNGRPSARNLNALRILWLQPGKKVKLESCVFNGEEYEQTLFFDSCGVYYSEDLNPDEVLESFMFENIRYYISNDRLIREDKATAVICNIQFGRNRFSPSIIRDIIERRNTVDDLRWVKCGSIFTTVDFDGYEKIEIISDDSFIKN